MPSKPTSGYDNEEIPDSMPLQNQGAIPVLVRLVDEKAPVGWPPSCPLSVTAPAARGRLGGQAASPRGGSPGRCETPSVGTDLTALYRPT
jgi:hypothetical protein